MADDKGNESVGDMLSRRGIEIPQDEGSLWQGPQQDGITFSLLSRFLVCRERFRLLVIKGLKPDEGWNHKLGYGNMWHLCEEAFAKGWQKEANLQILTEYAGDLCRANPLQQETINHWYNVCSVQFPIYAKYWEEHPDMQAQNRRPRYYEKEFSVEYGLPSGRVVKLRGKWDSVDVIKQDGIWGVWLQENKTKGDVNFLKIQRQLTFDLQTMIYMVALEQYLARHPVVLGFSKRIVPIVGVRYNVVRRPLSGGKGTIVRHKATGGSKCTKCKGTGTQGYHPRCSKCNGVGRMGGKPEETLASYYSRLNDIIEGDPGNFFSRFNVPVSSEDIQRFKVRCLNPILEQLCDWWEYMLANESITDPYSDVWSFNKNGIHWQHPFGVYNTLNEGGSSDLDGYLEDGNEAGLTRTDNLFPELKGL